MCGTRVVDGWQAAGYVDYSKGVWCADAESLITEVLGLGMGRAI